MRRYCFFVFIAALLSVTACDQKSKGTGAGSEARGVPKVRVFTWSDYMDPKTDSGFSAATGIPVETEYFESNRVLEQRLMGRESGFDVVVPSSGFIGNQIEAGLYRKLDKSKLTGLANLDPVLMKMTESYDPGHEYSVPYMWGTVGLAYNKAMIRQRMPDAPLGSWAMLLDPAVVSRFKDCGVAILDSPHDVVAVTMIYLGKDPRSAHPEDYEAAAKALAAIRPYIRYLSNTDHINDLTQGKVCLAMAWNIEAMLAQARAEIDHTGAEIGYATPKEGTMLWVDNLAMPVDAPDPESGLRYIDHLLKASVAADDANFVHMATPNRAALEQGLISPAERDAADIYPPAAVLAKSIAELPVSSPVAKEQEKAWAAFRNAF